ncbi:erythromycin esterase family protein [Streptomyces sp. NPDC002044]|uniref:erythromycin esterase family protein n=1 Tax=Streptomyces sp. NPDC002044 TaxID=3154662 RepID=UPI003318E305
MRQRTSALSALLLLAFGAVLAAAPPAPAVSPVPALERAAHPLRTTEPTGALEDLRPVGRMVGDARVVGLGEATHSSHEFFTMKHRVFRYLVEEKGFRTFALEGSWSTGLRLDDYVLHGKGDVRQIMREEFQNTYSWWNSDEYLGLLRWMREYNVRHPADPVRFMGDDFAYTGPELYDQVTGYVARARPALLPEITRLYGGLRPTASADAYMNAYLAKPLAERRELAVRTGRALALLTEQRPGSGAGADGAAAAADGEAYAWAVQHATAIDQTARGYAFDFADPAQVAACMRYRDSVMADNVDWWQRNTGDKVLLSAHNAHLALETRDPAQYPQVQGGFLRDRLGTGYVSIGTTFDRGSFNATGEDGKVRRHTLGPARPGSNEYTLDRVGPRDYVLDLRTAPPAARTWLATARTTRSIGTAYTGPSGAEYPVSLASAHDIVIHLHRITAARLLPAGPAPAAGR